MSRLLSKFGIVLLTTLLFGALVPGFSPEQLVRDSTVIAIGKLHILNTSEASTTIQGTTYPAAEYTATLEVESVLKHSDPVPAVIYVRWILPKDTAGSFGYHS